MATFSLLIIYKKGFSQEQKAIIKGVSNYGIQESNRCFYFVKNNFRNFVPIEAVVFFGREFDYKDETEEV